MIGIVFCGLRFNFFCPTVISDQTDFPGMFGLNEKQEINYQISQPPFILEAPVVVVVVVGIKIVAGPPPHPFLKRNLPILTRQLIYPVFLYCN